LQVDVSVGFLNVVLRAW